MAQRLATKVAIVLEAGSPMGRAIAHRFVREGARVVCVDCAPGLSPEAPEFTSAILTIHGDPTSESDLEKAVSAAQEHFGRLDVLINSISLNGGEGAEEHEINGNDLTDEAEILRARALMSSGPALMKKVGGGAVVNVASIYEVHRNRTGAAYTFQGFTKSMALEYARHKVRVNSITTVWSDETSDSVDEPDVMSIEGGKRHLGVGERQELSEAVANATLFLASEESSYVTGFVLPINGSLRVENFVGVDTYDLRAASLARPSASSQKN